MGPGRHACNAVHSGVVCTLECTNVPRARIIFITGRNKPSGSASHARRCPCVQLPLLNRGRGLRLELLHLLRFVQQLPELCTRAPRLCLLCRKCRLPARRSVSSSSSRHIPYT